MCNVGKFKAPMLFSPSGLSCDRHMSPLKGSWEVVSPGSISFAEQKLFFPCLSNHLLSPYCGAVFGKLC